MARRRVAILFGAWVVVGGVGCTGNQGTSGAGGSAVDGSGGAATGGSGIPVSGMGGRGSGGAANDAGGDAKVDATPDARAPVDASGDGGSVSSCAAGRFAICEDFEGTAVGAILSGWGKSPSNATNVQVASDQAYRGSHSLKMLAQASGARNITKSASALGALAAGHWGRMFYRVQTPAPAPPSNGVIHSTLVSLSGQSPLPVADNVNVRVVDTVVRDFDGKHQFLYNVQVALRRVVRQPRHTELPLLLRRRRGDRDGDQQRRRQVQRLRDPGVVLDRLRLEQLPDGLRQSTGLRRPDRRDRHGREPRRLRQLNVRRGRCCQCRIQLWEVRRDEAPRELSCCADRQRFSSGAIDVVVALSSGRSLTTAPDCPA